MSCRASNTGSDDYIGNPLGFAFGHRNDGDIDGFLCRQLRQLIDPAYGNAVPFLADLLGIRIEHRLDEEPLVLKGLVREQRQSQVPRTTQCDAPVAAQAKDVADLPAQLTDVVTQSSTPKVAEEREILTHLRRSDDQPLPGGPG